MSSSSRTPKMLKKRETIEEFCSQKMTNSASKLNALKMTLASCNSNVNVKLKRFRALFLRRHLF